MNRVLPVARLALFIVLAVWLGGVLLRMPSRLTLSLPDRGVEVAAPRNLEGWVLEPGEGEVLVKGHSMGGLVTLEIVRVPVAQDEIDRVIAKRNGELKAGKENYIVWHQGMDAKFGYQPAPTYKATYTGRIWGPLKGEIWQYDSYWPYRGQFARISMRYPNFLASYIYPDKMFLGANIKLEK